MTAQRSRERIIEAGRKFQEQKHGVRGLQQREQASLRNDAFHRTHAGDIQPKSQTSPFISR